MISFISFFFFFNLPIGYLHIGAAQISANVITNNLEDLNWLAGCWVTTEKTITIQETWLKPHHNIMLGLAQTYNLEKTSSFEYTRIEIRNDSLLFIAKPSKQAEATFNCVKFEKNSIVFENKQHDFPQVISYILKDEKTLDAFISGTYKGKSKTINFNYKKEDCNK